MQEYRSMGIRQVFCRYPLTLLTLTQDFICIGLDWIGKKAFGFLWYVLGPTVCCCPMSNHFLSR